MPEPEAHRSIPSRRPGIASALGVVVLAGRIAVTMAAVPAPALAADLVIGAAAGGLTVDGDVGEWQDKPPSLLLQPTAGTGRGGRVWLAESEDGLIVAGLVDGPPPRFVAKGEDPGGADRVELSVAMAEPKLPKIGWTEASAPVVVAAAEDCAHVESLAEDTNGIADCEAWVREQADYRRHLLDLFARHWRLAPGVGEEDLASRAFAALPPALRDGLTPLAPKGAPIARFMVPRDSGYSFEILVPWDQLPPSAGLELSRLRLLVDAVMPGPPASPKGPRGEAAAGAAKAAMLPARLEPPRRWRLSRCGYPLGGFDTDGGTTTPAPAFFTPAAGAEIGRIFIADNPVVAYSPPPDDNSDRKSVV